MESRKKEILPDVSYDLDGDGFVGGRDYVVARRFDEGFKNYLTKEERDKAIEAVKNVSYFCLKSIQLFRVTRTNLYGTSKQVALRGSTESSKREVSWSMPTTTTVS